MVISCTLCCNLGLPWIVKLGLSYIVCLPSLIENLLFIINDMKSEIVNRAQYPRKPGTQMNEKFKNMAKKAFG